MANTSFFTQCENCAFCDKATWGYYCDKHGIHISTPDKDGCTWGIEQEVYNAKKAD